MAKKMQDTVGGSSIYYNNGIFIDRCTIVSVEDKSNYPKRPEAEKKTVGPNGYETELCLDVNLEGGRRLRLFGNYAYVKDKVSGRKIYKGWEKKGNAVQSFLARMLGEDNFYIDDNDVIYSKDLKQLVGKEFYKLRYCVGKYTADDGTEKPSFKDYRRIQLFAEGNDIKLLNEFKKNSTYLKDYDPTYFDKWKKANDDSTTFNPTEFEDPNTEDTVI